MWCPGGCRTGRWTSRLQHPFDDLPRVHLLEGGPPLGKWRNPVEDQVKVEAARREEPDDLLPDRPVVRVAALERHRLLHQLVEREVERLRPPADLRYLAGRPHDVQGELQCRGHARGVDDEIEAVPVPEAFGPRRGVLALRPQRRVGADLERHVETVGVGGDADHDDMARSREPRHHGAEESDRPRADDRDRVAGTKPGIDAPRVVGDAARLGQGRRLECELLRDMVQAALRDLDEFRHLPVDAVAEAQAVGVEVKEALPRERRGRVDDGRRLAHDPVALREILHSFPGLRDHAPELVPEDHGVVHLPAVFPGELVEVAPADSHGLDRHEHVGVADLGDRDITHLDAVGLRREVDDGLHILAHGFLSPLIAMSPYAWTFVQISRRVPSRSPDAVLNASLSTVRGAPRTTSGAPYSGGRTACSIERPPTAWTGPPTARTTSRRRSSGLGGLPPDAAMPRLSS